jgi:seryl-tRNA synthetase
MTTEKKIRLPRAMGKCADKLYEVRQKRLALQKEVDALKAEETAIKNHIINKLPKSQASGIAGSLARATVITKEQPQVKDQEAFRKYMNRTKRFDLANNLQPSAPAIRDMWEEGKDIPGVEKFNVVTVSLNKV